MLDDSDLDLPQEPAPTPPRRSGSRSFVVVAGALGAIMLLALVGLAVYALVILPQQQAAAPPEVSSVQQTNTAIAQGLQVTNTPTRTATATRTATSTRTPAPPTATNTPVTPLFSDTPGTPLAGNAATQTVDALLTQAALAQTQAATGAAATSSSPSETPTATVTALPQSGIGDELGGPGLLIASAALLLLVIVAARRLRSA